MNYESIKNFCFEVLGDFVNPECDIEIEQQRNGKFVVMVLRSRGIPKQVLWDEWSRAAAGTEFENVTLFV